MDFDHDNKNEDENYDPNNDADADNEDNEIENYELDDEDAYDCIDQDELGELLAKPREEKEANPINRENGNDEEQNDEAENEPGDEEPNAEITEDDDDTESMVSTRRELPGTEPNQKG